MSARTATAQQIAPTNVGPESELGIHLGGFMLYPSLDLSGQYNDNVFAVDTGAKSDVSWDVHPALRLESTWTHYLVVLKAEYDLRRFDTLTQENTDNYLFGGETKFDLGSDTQFDATSEYARLSELPGNTNVTTNAAKPTNYFRWNNAADIKHVFDRLQVDIGGAYTTLRFQNTPAVGGGTLFEVDRNRDVASAYLDLGYQFSPGYQVFARANWNQRDYELAVFKFRNSTGYQADAGVRVQLSHLVDGQAYVGYLQQDYKAPLTNIGGVDYGAQLHWSATRLTDVTLDVHRSIEETDQVGATGYFATVASLDVSHALTRSVTLNANVAYTNNDYHGVVRNEDIYTAGFGIDYHFRPQIHLVADYQYNTRDSNVPGTNYSQNIVEAHLRLAL
ncbi:MAG: outer membrane beta-barrel protein [Rhizomicrobium sp.]